MIYPSRPFELESIPLFSLSNFFDASQCDVLKTTTLYKNTESERRQFCHYFPIIPRRCFNIAFR